MTEARVIFAMTRLMVQRLTAWRPLERILIGDAVARLTMEARRTFVNLNSRLIDREVVRYGPPRPRDSLQFSRRALNEPNQRLHPLWPRSRDSIVCRVNAPLFGLPFQT